MMKFKTLDDLVKWLHRQYAAGYELPTRGNVSFHVYRNKVDPNKGGVKGTLWLGRAFAEADMGFLEETPGVLTVAVVPNGELSIDWPNGKEFGPEASLEALLEKFPEGRNIGAIVEIGRAHV